TRRRTGAITDAMCPRRCRRGSSRSGRPSRRWGSATAWSRPPRRSPPPSRRRWAKTFGAARQRPPRPYRCRSNGRMRDDVNIEGWLASLERRHLANLSRSELTRALRALSSCYVERRDKLTEGAALEGAGKRAAFALFYAPLHFITVTAVVRAMLAHGLP